MVSSGVPREVRRRILRVERHASDGRDVVSLAQDAVRGGLRHDALDDGRSVFARSNVHAELTGRAEVRPLDGRGRRHREEHDDERDRATREAPVHRRPRPHDGEREHELHPDDERRRERRHDEVRRRKDENREENDLRNDAPFAWHPGEKDFVGAQAPSGSRHRERCITE